jgi:chromosome segregation ATPase
MDIERTIEFLLQQQTRFAESQSRLTERHEQFEAEVSQVTDLLLQTNAAVERTNAILTALAEAHVELGDKHEADISQVLQQQARFAESQSRLTERHEQFEAEISQVTGLLLQTNARMEQTSAILTALAEAHAELGDKHEADISQVTLQEDRLAESQSRLTERHEQFEAEISQVTGLLLQTNARMEQTSAILTALAEAHAELGTKHEADISRVNSVLHAVAASQERTNGIVIDVASSQERTNEILAALAEAHVELANEHKKTEEGSRSMQEALRKLMDVVERHITGHR